MSARARGDEPREFDAEEPPTTPSDRASGVLPVAPRAPRARGLELVVLGDHRTSSPPARPTRPLTRGECQDGARPCPWVKCRYNLVLESQAPEGPSETCALDVADRGGATLQEVAAILGLSRERVRQIEDGGLASFRKRDRRGVLAELLEAVHEQERTRPDAPDAQGKP